MIKFFDKIEDLKKESLDIGLEVDLDAIRRIDLPFVESQKNFTVLNIPSYGPNNFGNVILVAKENVFIYSSFNGKAEKKLEKVLKKKNGESTVSIFMVLKSILKNYSQEFLRIRDAMNALDFDPVLDSIEDTGRDLRRLTDRMEALFQVIIELKEDDLDCFDTSLINFEYDLLNAEARYWLDRCRSHNYRISSLRTKSEMKSNRELNDTMKKLTVIVTFLTIVSIVINVPGTIGAIFGIPALSDAYFSSHVTLLIITLVSTTVLSVLLGFVYWKSLKLKQT